jgi:hypothetical protein
LDLQFWLLKFLEYLQLPVGGLFLLFVLIFLDVAGDVPHVEAVDSVADEVVQYLAFDFGTRKVAILRLHYLLSIALQTAAKIHFLSFLTETDLRMSPLAYRSWS